MILLPIICVLPRRQKVVSQGFFLFSIVGIIFYFFSTEHSSSLPLLPNQIPTVIHMMISRTTTLSFLLVWMAAMITAFPQPKPQYNGGGGVGRLVLDEWAGKEGTWKCHYDMVLVERLQKRKSPQQVEEGALYVPDEDLPRLHLCKILSIGPGREEENGMTAPDVNGLQPGDIVIAKNPWGIGPKDEELADGTKLSFMRSQDIAAKITGGLVAQ